MRKIMTREERKGKETRNKVIVSLILVGLLVLSTAGYAFYQTGKGKVKKLDYRGVKFVLDEDSLWHFSISGQEFSTTYNPKQTENISGFLSLNLQNYVGKPLYFSYNSNRQGIEEITKNIARFVLRVQFACLDGCQEDLPVKNCTDTDNIIVTKNINETLIKQENNCVYILAREDDAVRAADAFIFKILGIQ
jgi:hypothetical protein